MKNLRPIFTPPTLMLEYYDSKDKTSPLSPSITKISLRHAQQMHELYDRLKNIGSNKEKIAYLNNLLKVTFGDDHSYNLYEKMIECIIAARDFRRELADDFLPTILQFCCSSDANIDVTDQPIDVIDNIFKPHGGDSVYYRKIRSFVALANWVLAQRYLNMLIQNSGLNANEHLRRVTNYLEDNVFDTQECHCFRTATLEIFYDNSQNGHNRYKGIKEVTFFNQTGEETSKENIASLKKLILEKSEFINGGNLPTVQFRVYFRVIKVGKISYLVLYAGRNKKQNEVFRKTLLYSNVLTNVSDQRAIMIVCISPRSSEILQLELSRHFPFTPVNFDWEVEDDGVNDENPNSADEFKVAEQFKGCLHGKPIEVRFMTLKQFFNSEFSTGPENHNFYKLRRVIPLLEILWPQALYRINFNDPSIYAQMEKLQFGKIESSFSEIKKIFPESP